VEKSGSSYIYVAFVVLFWSSTAAVGKLLLADLASINLLFIINLLATSALFTIVLLQGKIGLIPVLKIRDYLTFSYMGFLGVFLYTLLLFEALKIMSAQEAFILNYLWPIIVVILSAVILGEKLTTRKIIGVFFSFLGVFIIITAGDPLSLSYTNLRGSLYVLLAAVSYGLFSVMGKKLNYDGYLSMMFYYFFGTVFSSIPVLVQASFPRLTLTQILGVLWLGVFANGLAFVLWFQALKYGDTTLMSNIVFLTPFLSLVYAYLLLGEKIIVTSVIGLTLIVIGILVQSMKDPRAFITQ
jgi:drug/metabolite transporter (DMT)-like permease